MNKYIILAIVVVLVNFGQSFILPTGGVFADSLSYFEIATDLPKPVTDLFPLGYPAFLRAFFEIFKDYFWAYKFLHVTMLIVVFVFSYFKKFFFKETVLLFMGKTLLFVFSIAISEGPFLFLMYFMLYFLYQVLCTDSYSVKDILGASLIMILMFATRYSGIYVFLGIGLFSIFMFFKPQERKQFRSMFLFLLISGLGIAGYLAFNYFTFGSFTGEDLRGQPHAILKMNVLRDFLGTVNSINPYIGLKPSSNSFVSIGFQFLMMGVDIAIFVYFLKYFKKAKAGAESNFHLMLWTIAGVYAICLFGSGLVQQIEEMNTRMQAAVNVCLFFSFLIIYFRTNTSDKTIFRLSLFFFCFGVLYFSKRPEIYFENRKEIEPQMSKFSSKKYMFNDERGENALTTYTIPIINKSFQYRHTNGQIGDTKQSIAGTINPKIKWLKYDTIKTDKSKVLYTSEIKLNLNKK
ncbi:hypothetical protein [Soonwooa sp.]|uniref:hypothetical protein n=1 Tax=Soonwooa sp. TaxID=1938592 RepID=UPI00262BB4EA|nr:hypothetical protein [Soonwooa sp.]